MGEKFILAIKIIYKADLYARKMAEIEERVEFYVAKCEDKKDKSGGNYVFRKCQGQY